MRLQLLTCRYLTSRSASLMLAAGLLFAATVHSAHAVNITLDYTYDTSNFFGAGNPSGATAGGQAKAALEAAAGFYSTILTDTFSAIQTPPDFQSAFGGTATFEWTMGFSNPSSNSGAMVTLSNQVVATNEYRIYAGARNIAGSTLGVGGYSSGGFGYSVSGVFGPGEYNAQVQKAQQLETAVTTRGQSSGFSAWGGSITFDRDGSTTWHYNHTTAPTVGTSDFYSVAIHELGHALGLGVSEEWQSLAIGPNSTFTGGAATSLYGGNPPLDPGLGHWKAGTMSQILSTSTSQEAAMDPDLTTGTRKRLTKLDAAALTDIGWSVNAPPPPTYNPADFNEDTFVNGADLTQWKSAFGLNANGDADGDNDTDGADYLIWQRNYGATSSHPAGSGAFAAVPEPSAALVAAIGVISFAFMYRRQGCSSFAR